MRHPLCDVREGWPPKPRSLYTGVTLFWRRVLGFKGHSMYGVRCISAVRQVRRNILMMMGTHPG